MILVENETSKHYVNIIKSMTIKRRMSKDSRQVRFLLVKALYFFKSSSPLNCTFKKKWLKLISEDSDHIENISKNTHFVCPTFSLLVLVEVLIQNILAN